MAISFPESIETIYNRVISDIRSALSYGITFLRNHFFRSIAVSYSTRIFEVYEQQKILLRDIFISTAEGEFADLWGSIIGLNRYAATQSSGHITAFGTLFTIIPLGTILISSSGNEYTTTEEVEVLNNIIQIDSLIRNGSIVTATTTSEHHFVSGMNVTIAGADQSEYNGSFEIIVSGIDEFTYQITGTPITPATGTITVVSDNPYADIPILSLAFGDNTNLDSGVELDFQTPIPNISATATVQFEGLIGGKDQETDENYRIRYLEKYANPSSPFGIANIKRVAESIPDITRTFVKPIYPEIGDTSVYVVTDERENIVPLSSDLKAVKDAIVAQIKPASMNEENLYVKSPIVTDTTFNITGLIPNTLTMQQAIKDNLNAYFRIEPELSVGITESIYKSVIASTIDPTNNDTVKDFTLLSPTGTLGGGAEELVTYDSTTFS